MTNKAVCRAMWRQAIGLLALATTITASPCMVTAATLTWDADGTTTTGSATDGAGTWLGANQWWDGSSNVSWASGDDAVFGVGGTGGAVTLSASTTAASLLFNSFSGTYALGTSGQALTLGSGGLTMNAGAGGVTLSSPVTLGTAQSWINNSSSLLTTSAALANGGHLFTVAGIGNTTLAAISGSGGLTKTGAGTLTLSGSNSYTGGTTVSGGTLTLASGAVAGSFNGVIRGSLTVTNGATVNATQAWSLGAGGPNSSQPATRSVTDITLSGGTLNITNATIKGGMSPTTITMTGGALTGEPVQWYYGNSGTVSLVTNASGTTSTVSTPIALRLNKTAGAGSLTFNVAAGTAPDGVDLLVSGAISNAVDEGGGGRIIKSGAGTLRMTAINSYTDGTTVEAGTLSLGNGAANGVIRGSLAIQSGARVVASAQGWSLGFGGTRTGATFAGNSVTAITIDGGTLEFTNSQSGAGLAANEVTLTGGTIAGASFGWINSNTLTPTLRTLASASRSTLQGGISLRLSSSGTLTFDVASGSTPDGIDLLVSGPISPSAVSDNAGGVLAKTGAGTLVLAGTNTSTGGVILSSGTLSVQGSMAANQNYTISNATLRIASGTFNALGLTTSGTVTINAGGLLVADNATANAHNLATIVLAGGTMSSGTGSLTGALANFYINGGITATGSTTSTISASLGRSTVVGAPLSITVDAGATLNASGPIVNITGANPLAKSGDGRLVLSGANTFSGGLTLSAGHLDLNAPSSLGSGGFTIAGGTIGNSSGGAVTLSTNNTQAWNGDFTFAGPNALNLGTGAVTLGANRTVTVASGLLTVGGAISGTFGLAKSGGGELSLGGANSYSGGTTVSGGTLTLASGSVAGNFNGVIRGSLTVSSGATVNATQGWSLGAGGPNSSQPTTQSVTDITLSGGTLNITNATTKGGMSPTTITMTGGALTGEPVQWYFGNSSSVSLVTNASGTTSTVSAPIALRLNKTAGAGSLTFNVAAGTTPDGVDLLVSGAISNAAETDGGGRIVKSGAGRMVLSGSNTFTDGLTLAAGQLDVNSTTALGTGTFTITGGTIGNSSNGPVTLTSNNAQVWNSDVTFAGPSNLNLGAGGVTMNASRTVTVSSGTLTVGGVISGSSLGLTKNGAGTLTLSGLNTFTGGVTLAAGRLDINRATALGTGTFTIAGGTIGNSSGAAITLTSNNAQAWNSDFMFTGPNNLNLGTGAVTLNASRTVTVSAGTLTVGGAVATGNFSLAVAGAGNAAFSGVISGSAGLTKAGTGTLTLSGLNTFTGGVTLTGGTLTVQAQNGQLGSLQPNQNFSVTNATLTTSGGNYNAFGSGGGSGWTSGTASINAGGLLYAGNTSSNAHNLYNVVLSGGTLGAGAGTLNVAFANWYIGGSITATGSTTSTISASLGKTASGVALPVAVDAGSTLAVSGPIVNISGANGLTKTGAGRMILSAANTFTGPTSITGGRLQIDPTGSINATSGITINGGELQYNASTPLSQPITFTAGTISGTGTIGTAVTVAANDVLSPGNSPGSQSYAAGLTWSGSGSYLWELNALSGTAGVNWDVINVSGGTFNLSGLSAENRFILDLITLTSANTPGGLDAPYGGDSFAFLIAGYDTLTTPLGTAAGTDLTSLFDIRLTNWAGPQPQAIDISVRINGTQTGLELVIVPEPAGLIAATVGIAAASWSLRKWRTKRASR